MKNIALLGSTGSIGTQTLDVVSHLEDFFKIRSLAAGKNIALLSEQAEKFSPEKISVADEEDAKILRKKFLDIKIFSGEEGLCKLASDDDVDIVVNAVVGAAGLMPSLCAIKNGKRLCTANKESLVMAGELLTSLARKTGAEIFPIDSEHSALWQAMLSGEKSEIKRLILTASGGPFFQKNVDLKKITPQDALKHPNWSMGKKITIDSATMMNKTLEIIEAHWLFNIPPEKIDVLIHPQSIVHSIVEFVDGSQIAQMSIPDMRLPIQYALTYPRRYSSSVGTLELWRNAKLEFFKPDTEKFPALKLAYRVLKLGGTAPAILNAANEVAVSAFLEEKIAFNHIFNIVESAIEDVKPEPADSIEKILTANEVAKKYAVEKIMSVEQG
ncbi:1-deoxy-D-xylulose-5-phosphate reductoisomerase [bacterium]|nr:MAG: 1-deoxy-D-xylulose-5-phosphate reductoisomerase [bacterium]